MPAPTIMIGSCLDTGGRAIFVGLSPRGQVAGKDNRGVLETKDHGCSIVGDGLMLTDGLDSIASTPIPRLVICVIYEEAPGCEVGLLNGMNKLSSKVM